MKALLLALAPAVIAGAAHAQAQDPHAGHVMPAQPAAKPADPHAGHVMPAAPAPAADPHAGHDMGAMTPRATNTGADMKVGSNPAPPVPMDNLADAIWGGSGMAASRDVLRAEHGGAPQTFVLLDRFEIAPGSHGDPYAWEGRIRYGGDIDRVMFKTSGAGARGEGIESADVQLLWAHALDRYFDLQVGVRQDIEPKPRRTYASVGFEGLAPYWFDIEGALLVSDRGEVSAEIEGSYDLRITQRLILQPTAEARIGAQTVAATGLGAGLSDIGVGLRLRYEIRREFAPYIGVEHERSFGDAADLARASGEGRSSTRVVLGIRAWF